MSRSGLPFNIDLLEFKPETTKWLRPVTSLDIYDGVTKNLHPEGLYSTEIFGTVGTEARYKKYSYIHLKIEILHPLIFNALVQLKGLYKDILSGREFAQWDEETKDFVKSNALDGQTGYQFFMEHWQAIVFPERPSTQREQNIQLIQNYKARALSDKVFVIPAGYRDLEVDDNGRESSDEINALYYKLVAISNTINPATVKVAPQAYNSQRWSLQATFNEIYDALMKIIEGKKNLLMGKWASRKIFNGTRNVITSMDSSVPVLGAPGNVHFNHTAVGLYQCMKALLPVARFQLKNGFLASVFPAVSAPALLTHRKTLRAERVLLNPEDYDRWMTNEGLETLITSYKESSIRDLPIQVNDYYLGLLYRGPDGTFKFIHGIEELPEGRDPKDCTPITLTELFYAALYPVAGNYVGFVTRYPIASAFSCYPSKIFLKSTIKSEVRRPLDAEWRPMEEAIAYQFPVKGSATFDSLSPAAARLKSLGADFDGDYDV